MRPPGHAGSAGLLLLAVGTLGSCGALRDPRGEPCGFNNEPVSAQIAMEHARDYRRHLPNMGLSPELDSDLPAFVVVFAGPIDLPTTGAPAGNLPRAQMAQTGVVCIVVGNSPTYYVNVDTTGMN